MKPSAATRKLVFPENILVTRVEEDGSHYFLAHENVGEVDDDAGDVVIYERRTLGTVETEKRFITEG